MWVAELETRNYCFRSFGRTKKHARETMRRVWAKHAEEIRGAFGEMPDLHDYDAELAESVWVYRAKPGHGMRDDEEIVSE